MDMAEFNISRSNASIEERQLSSGANFAFYLNITISFVEISGNGLILMSLRRAKRFSKSTCYLIGNLACADMAFGLLHGLKVIFTLFGTMNTVACVIFGLGLMSFGAISVWGVCFIFIDCYRSISKTASNSKPIKYGALIIAFNWIFCICFAFLSFINPGASTIPPDECAISHDFFNNGFLTYLWSLLTLTFLATITAMAVTLRALKTSLKGLFQGGNSNTTATELKKRSLQKQGKVINLFVIIMVAIGISWGPLYGGVTLLVFCRDCGLDFSVVPILAAFTPINSCVNVLVYAVKDPSFRKDFTLVLKCRFNKVSGDGATTTGP